MVVVAEKQPVEGVEVAKYVSKVVKQHVGSELTLLPLPHAPLQLQVYQEEHEGIVE